MGRTAASGIAAASPVQDDGSGLAKRIVRALFWMVLDNGGSQILSFLVYGVLTRLLRPSDFGVFALALAVTSVVAIPLQGVGNALVQSETLSEDDLTTAFWTNLSVSFFLAGAMYLAASWIAAGFGVPQLGAVLQGIAPLYILRALASIHAALCQRALKMSVFAARTAAGYAMGGVVAIALALLGWRVACLVVFQIVQAAVVVVTMWWAMRWRPRMRFSPVALRRLRGFSLHIITAQLLVTCAEKTDGLAIGLLLNVTALGYYDIALKLLQGIALLSMAPFQAVAMPVLSRLAQDRAAFGLRFTQLVTASSAIWTPAACCLAVTAPILVPLAFGPRWSDAVPVLQAMCVGCTVMPVWGLTGGGLAAAGRSELYVRVSAAQLGIAATAFSLAAPFGIVATGWAWLAMSLLLLPVSLSMLRRALGMRIAPVLVNIGRIAASGLLMACAATLVRYTWGGGSWATGAALLAGVIAYLGSLELVTLRGYVSGVLRAAWQSLPALQRAG